MHKVSTPAEEKQFDHHILMIPSWFSREGAEGVFIREHARMTAGMGCRVGMLYVSRAPVFRTSRSAWWEDAGVYYGMSSAWHLPKTPLLMQMWERQIELLFHESCRRNGTPDLIHAHGYLAGIAARHLSFRTGIPYVLTEHNTAIPMRRIPWYHVSALRKVYRDADALIAVSAFLKKAMQRWTSRADVHVICNPVDLQKFALRDPGPAGDQGRLIFVGDLEARKQPSMLLQALGRVEGVTCQIVGNGPLLPALRRQAQALGVGERITWLGYRPPDEIPGIMQKARILISTSRVETFGMTIAEGMACGLAVVTTDSGAPAEYVDARSGIVVPVDEPEALAKAISSILHHPENYEAERIRAHAARTFDFPVIAQAIRRVYRSVWGTTG